LTTTIPNWFKISLENRHETRMQYSLFLKADVVAFFTAGCKQHMVSLTPWKNIDKDSCCCLREKCKSCL